jgi:hypothetical protein
MFHLYCLHLRCIPPFPPLPPPLPLPLPLLIEKLHVVNSFRTWIYYPTELLLQLVTDSLMETDQEGDGDGRRGNPKERMPEKGTELTE